MKSSQFNLRYINDSEWALIITILCLMISTFIGFFYNPVVIKILGLNTTIQLPEGCAAYVGEVGATNSLTGARPITQVAITCSLASTMEIEDAGRTIRLTPPPTK